MSKYRLQYEVGTVTQTHTHTPQTHTHAHTHTSNTQVISLSGACVSTFMTSVLVGGRINPVHIQNATLAGGVAMGAACTLPVRWHMHLELHLRHEHLTMNYNNTWPWVRHALCWCDGVSNGC